MRVIGVSRTLREKEAQPLGLSLQAPPPIAVGSSRTAVFSIDLTVEESSAPPGNSGRNPFYVSSRATPSPASSPRTPRTPTRPSSRLESNPQRPPAAKSITRRRSKPSDACRSGLFRKPPPCPSLTRMFLASCGNVVELPMGTLDQADCIENCEDSSTQAPSDCSTEDVSLLGESEGPSRLQSSGLEDELSVEHELACSTTVAAIEAFVAWLKESGQSTMMLMDLPSETMDKFSRLSCLVAYQTSLPLDVASQRLWQRILRELRGEANCLPTHPFF